MNPRDDLERAYDALAPGLYRYALMVLADPGSKVRTEETCS